MPAKTSASPLIANPLLERETLQLSQRISALAAEMENQ